jgi:predicted GNAT family N-acyltransferase
MSNELNIRDFIVREADWSTERNVLSNIRRLVFIVEQNVPQEEEWDGQDDDSWHFLALDNADAPIGTARLLPDGQIGRMSVLEEFRGTGVGRVLLEAAVDKARHLGFDQVFLHAQTHALNFYAKAGFVAEGDEFDEAGIPHQAMRMVLEPLEDNVQRKQAVTSELDIGVKTFDTREADWEQQGKLIRVVRQSVLTGELGLPKSHVLDELDETALHWIAEENETGQVVGSIRMTVDDSISRLAVLPEHRGKGIGLSLLELAVAKGIRFSLKVAQLDGQAALEGLFNQAGFHKTGNAFDVDGIAHQHFERELSLPEKPQIERTRTGADYGDESAYHLGEDNKLILLRREEDFRNVILEMCRQATQSIRIHSPVLDHKLFDSRELKETCSALARRNKYTFVEILLFDSHRVVKNGHALLEISRKLPSSISFRIVHPELRRQNHEYVLVDGSGVIYRQDNEIYDGYANFLDVTDCNRLGRQFTGAWESGLKDPNLRQLRM